MQLVDPPPFPRPTEPGAAPSRRAVQQLAALGQLDEERRTGVVAAVHAAASYCVSRFCGRDSHAGGRAMQAATEAGGAESGELLNCVPAWGGNWLRRARGGRWISELHSSYPAGYPSGLDAE